MVILPILLIRCLVIAILILAFGFIGDEALADWPGFRFDTNRSGATHFRILDLNPVRWTSENVGSLYHPPNISSNGDIYVSGINGITKLNPSGTVEWSSTSAINSINNPVIDNNGNVYISTSGCGPYLFAYSKTNTKLWSYNLRPWTMPCGSNQSRAAITLSPDQQTLYVGVSYPFQAIQAFSTDGKLKWSKYLGEVEPDKSSVTVGPNGNLYVGTNSRSLYSLSPAGKLLWSNNFATGYYVKVLTPIIGPDGKVYAISVNATGGEMLSSVSNTGSPKYWNYQVPNSTFSGEPAIKGDVIYLPERQNIRAINTTNGSLIWVWTADTTQNVTSPAIDQDGNIYTTSFNKVYAISPDGTTKNSLTLEPILGPVVIGGDGLLFVHRNKAGTDQGFVYALGTAPSLVTPVLFIPGIGGSELKVNQDTILTVDNGHGGIYSHAYPSGEKVWVNQDEAIKLGDDDYFDVLKLKRDGQTAEAPSVSLTGELSNFGYGEIDSFFKEIGYQKGSNFFIFPYDWRKDIRSTALDLDNLIETARQKSGQSKVDLVVHSMGGLVARNYIAEASKAAKVNKLIELGVPHLGNISLFKSLMYGLAFGRPFGPFVIGVSGSEVKDILRNLYGGQELLPYAQYFDFYNNTNQKQPYPFRDDRDIDKNQVTGALDYLQTKSLLANLGHNMTVFTGAEQFHSNLDPLLTQLNGVKLYEIVGSSQPTLGQIRESWWINWPIKLLPRREEIYINGDDTVPIYSASLKSDSLDLSAGAKIYYVDQRHSDLVRSGGEAMQTVRAILAESPSYPTQVKSERIALEGKQVSLHNGLIDLFDESNRHTGLNPDGEIETNIPDTFFDTTEDSQHVFIRKKAKKIKVKITSKASDKPNLTFRHYSQDAVWKTAVYRQLPLPAGSSAEFLVDPLIDTSPAISLGSINLTPVFESTASAFLDQTAPTTTVTVSGNKTSSGSYQGQAAINLSADDTQSGVDKIEYSLDDGQTVRVFDSPFTLSNPGTHKLQVKSIDKSGNEETPQTVMVTIDPTPLPNASSIPSDTSGTSGNEPNNPTHSNENPAGTTRTKAPNIIEKVLGVSYAPRFPESADNQKDILGVSYTPQAKSVNSSGKPNINIWNQAVLPGLFGSMMLFNYFKFLLFNILKITFFLQTISIQNGLPKTKKED